MRGCCCVWLCRQMQPFVHLAGKPGEQLTSFYGDVEGCRRAFAALIGAAQDDIALVPSTSYGMATAAKNLLPPGYLSRGDRLLVLEQQFQSNYYVWEEAAFTCGAELLVVERPPDFDWTAAVLGALSGADGRHVRLVSLPTVHWTDGTVVDLERIGVRCRELGCALVVDGTQSIGAAPFDVAKVQPDFLTASAYKWLLCPYGLAFLYASPRQQQSGQPLEFHNWERHGEGFYQYQYNAGARRFDAGQRSNFITLPASLVSLGLLREWGTDRIAAYIRPLLEQAHARARAIGLEVPPQQFCSAHMLGVRVPAARLGGAGLQQLAAALLERGIHVSIRGTAIRVAPHVWNTSADIHRLFNVLSELLPPLEATSKL
jgi:selenocysteine lyase/cysteine desulfurase